LRHVLWILVALAAPLQAAILTAATPAVLACVDAIPANTPNAGDARSVVPVSTPIRRVPAPPGFALPSIDTVTNDADNSRPAQHAPHSPNSTIGAERSLTRGNIRRYRYHTDRPTRLYLTVSSRLRE